MRSIRARLYACLHLLLLLFSSLSTAGDIYILDPEYENATRAQSVVEVLGTLKGSGVLTYLDQKPIVITNSHVLQGRKTARVTLHKRYLNKMEIENKEIVSNEIYVPFSLTLDLQVIHDFPFTDFSILAFPESLTKTQKAVVEYYASKNGGFCLTTSRCKKGWHYPKKPSYEFSDNIAAVLDGKPTATKVFASTPSTSHKVNTRSVPDEFTVPVYAKPGVSGGAYYQQGVLMGLVTKVSLTGEPYTIATSFRKIGDVLAKPNTLEQNTRWSEKGQLIIQQGPEEIILQTGSNAGGGETGHGGGETGHGGDGINSQYWNLEIPDATGRHLITTWNPMFQRYSSFKINGEETYVLKVQNKYVIPTFEKYQSNKKKLDLLIRNEQNLSVLENERVSKPFEMNQARYYSYDKTKNIYSVHKFYDWQAGLFPGAQYLLPNKDGKWSKNTRYFFSASGKNPDADGYYVNVHFSAKRTDGLILDIIFNPSEEPKLKYSIKANADLKQISIASDGKEQILERTPFHSPGTLLFENQDKTIKAVYTYDSDDLLSVQKVFIQTQDYLIELGSGE